MPEYVLLPEIEIIANGDRLRSWSAEEKLRVTEEM